MMTFLDIIAILLGLAAVFGYLNYRFVKLPHTIGLMIIALVASCGVLVMDYLWPSLGIGPTVRGVVRGIDFYHTLMEGFLSALLFAGAVHVDLSNIAQRKWAIGLMATFGVLTSTFLIGGAVWLVAGELGIALPFIWALVFGSLISPTDPVAVLSILKRVRVPPLIEAKIAGESLFNDGVAVVLFSILLTIATGGGAHGGEVGAADIARLFAVEALGGAALGAVFGLAAFAMIRAIDAYDLEIIITLALVTGTYAAALHLHVSGPIAVVIAGLLIGNYGAKFAMSEKSRRHIFEFWELTDEILNSVLFLLIGLEVLVIAETLDSIWLELAAIPIVLAARWIAVSIPIGLLAIRERFTQGAIRLLTWGGLRGGISVALALSLPETPYKSEILTTTYAVVLFSIIVQGLTMEPLARRILASEAGSEPGTEEPEHASPPPGGGPGP